MRVWTWQHSGPAEPPLDDMFKDMDGRHVVWDSEDKDWHRDERGHWHRNSPDDPTLNDLPWSTMLELVGPLRNGPQVEAPLP
jgi:hypothetical protein